MAHFPVRKLKTFTRPGRQIDDSSDEIPKTPAQIYGPQTVFFSHIEPKKCSHGQKLRPNPRCSERTAGKNS